MPPFLQLLAIEVYEEDKPRADNVHTRQHVCVRIVCVEVLHHINKKIVSRENLRAQILPVREQRKADKRGLKADYKAPDVSYKSVLVLKEEVAAHQEHIRKPDDVRNNVKLVKRYKVIKRHIGNPIVEARRDPYFQNIEEKYVYGNIQKKPYMIVFFQE
jgi:hypothetical protein